MKKPITFIINTFMVGGVERLVLDIITHLDRDQWEPQVVTVLGGGPLLPDFQRLGIPIEFVGPQRYVAGSILYQLYWLVSLPAIMGRLTRALKRHGSSVVVTSLYHADIVGMLVAASLKVPQRVVIHHDIEKLPWLIAWTKRRLALPRATRVVANSQTVQAFLQNYFKVPAQKMVVIPNGININRFVAGSKLTDKANLMVGMIGRLEPIKGAADFVLALIKLKEHIGGQAIPALLAGGGSVQDQLKAVAQANGLNLRFMGEVTDVVPVLREIDILVVPSLAEGFGLVVLEGLVARKLIVASDLPAIRELITDGQNGLLFPAGDSAALASQLQRLLSDSLLRQQISTGVVQWLSQKSAEYDIGQVARRYQELWS
ncbi:glycosyltransferase family 4 protein [Patescibacteria group bacterium]|nr:glycosyltransferase family 4 protein [Patescibacteria group bacterium]